VKPYYADSLVTLYHADWREAWADVCRSNVLITDPPYGIAYKSGMKGKLRRSIKNDLDTTERDTLLERWEGPALVFGSWKRPVPHRTHTLLIWDTKGALGMGNLSIPWKPAHQQVYVIGRGFVGKRTSDVLRFAPVQAMAANGRVHPHQKPVALMQALIQKCPRDWRIADPFAGSGSTLVAAKALQRQAVGCEIEERDCEIAAARLSQNVLDLDGAA
jgi:DNA modification methylase